MQNSATIYTQKLSKINAKKCLIKFFFGARIKFCLKFSMTVSTIFIGSDVRVNDLDT